jgi:ankyrin repeat protein
MVKKLITLAVNISFFVFSFNIYAVAERWQNLDLLVTAKGGNIERLKKRLVEGVDPNVQLAGFWDNSTALIKAVEANQIEAVRILLVAGADPYIKDAHGKTAFDIARENGYSAILELLESAPLKQKIE